EASGDTGTQGKLSLSGGGALSFGSQTIGTPSTPQTVTLTNSGNGPLTITGLAVSGGGIPPATTGAPAGGNNAGDFALVPPVTTPRRLAAGESLPINVVFTPAGMGPRSA